MDIKLSKSEAKAIIKRNINKEWQHNWDTGTTGRHLYSIQQEVGTPRTVKRSTREENIITRLRVGHTKLNKTLHLINKHPSVLCEYCQVQESVEHVILHCQKYSREREIQKQEVVKHGTGELSLKNVFSFCLGGLIRFMKVTNLIKRV